MTTEKRPLTFIDGLGAGILVVVLVPMLYFLARGDAFAGMYRDFGDVKLPLTTRIALDPWWRALVPGVLVQAAIWALVRPPRFRYAMLVIALLAVIAVAFTYVAVYRPIWMLAGNIQ